MECTKNSSMKDTHRNTSLPQETRKILNKQFDLTLKEVEKAEQTKPKISKRKGIMKIRAEINKIGRKQ